ncbi:MAG: 5,10-methylenetetrahydrofolate reductase [Acidimicrobiaceae bacterium]|nr:5,10-methylenetetrahydrofolate reductase [Acidimicrobiaceae bacterium]
MARIDALLQRGRTISVELWPPRTPEAAVRLGASLERLEVLRPAFASITYGAGGSTRERTHDLVVSLRRAGRVTPMAHLVCAAHRRSELVEILTRYRDAGVENVLALRGDPPLSANEPLKDGELHHAIELAQLAKDVGGFCVAVAAHPGGHPLADNRGADLDRLAEKLQVADFAITQFFFQVEEYLELVEGLAVRGIHKPVVPGIMPITNVRTVTRMAELSGCHVPREIAERVEAVADDAEAVRSIGVEIATELCEKLLAGGVPGLHFYTMNQVRATLETCANLGLVSGDAVTGAAEAPRPGSDARAQ